VLSWPHARAGLVTLAIVVGLMDGCPIPPRKSAPDAIRPLVAAVGLGRKYGMKPFRPVGELFRLQQTWKLFPTARTSRHWMWIEARRRGATAWELLYRPNDPDHALWADRLAYRRIRGNWNPGNKDTRTGYGPFVEWVAGEIFAARPDVDVVRARMEKIEIDPRAGGFDELGRFDDQKIERREQREERARRQRERERERSETR
jgi:hypothetical protein